MIRCDIKLENAIKYLPAKEAKKLNEIIVMDDAKYVIECYLLHINSYKIRIKIMDVGIDQPELMFESYTDIDKDNFIIELNKVLN